MNAVALACQARMPPRRCPRPDRVWSALHTAHTAHTAPPYGTILRAASPCSDTPPHRRGPRPGVSAPGASRASPRRRPIMSSAQWPVMSGSTCNRTAGKTGLRIEWPSRWPEGSPRHADCTADWNAVCWLSPDEPRKAVLDFVWVSASARQQAVFRGEGLAKSSCPRAEELPPESRREGSSALTHTPAAFRDGPF